jgi:predicted transcriptional regulator
MATTVRLKDEDQAVLDELIRAEGLSGNEIIRRAILERAARGNHRSKVAAAWTEIDAEYSDLFERLRQV